MNANQATKEKTLPAMNGNAVLAAEPLDESAVLVELHDDDDEADEARPLAADAAAAAESPAPERAAEPPALPGAPGSADPVRLYLREMGHISLLTREGEVEIARRIEEGEDSLVREVLGTTHALVHVLGLAEQLRADTVRVRDLVRDDSEEETETPDDDEPMKRRFLAQRLAEVT